MAHPGLLWAVPRCCGGEARVEVQPAAVEVDGDSIMRSIPVALCHSLDLFDLRVEGLWNGVGDPVPQISEDVGKVVFDRLGGLDDGLQA